MTGPPYTTTDAVTVTGASYRQIDYWCRKGYVPGVRSAGSGVPRGYTLEQLLRIALLADLAAAGVKPGAVPANPRITANTLTLGGVSLTWDADKRRARILTELENS